MRRAPWSHLAPLLFPQRWLVAVAMITAGLGLAVGVSRMLEESERQAREEQFRKIALETAHQFRQEVAAVSDAMQSIGIFYGASREVERKEFRAFTAPLLKRLSGIGALAWAPRVTGHGRSSLESAVRAEGFSDFQILEWLDAGVMVSAAERTEYFPVTYLEPHEGHELLLGFDFASEPVRRAVMMAARDSGAIRATPKVKLVQEGHSPDGVVVFLPIYQNTAPTDTLEQRREGLAGFVAAIVRVSRFVQRALEKVELHGISFELEMPSADGPDAVYRFPSDTWGPVQGPARSSADVIVSERLTFAGQPWMFRCTLRPEALTRRVSWQPVSILMLGVLLTVIMTAYVLAILSHEVKTQQLVIKRTQELAEANQALDQRNRDLVRREAAMQSLLEDLEVAKRRIEEQAKTLQASNDKLREMAALKDEFVAKVSHELRTPLTSVKEGLSLMLDGALGQTTADQQDFLKTMDGDVDRLTELINNMLDLSKIEAGRMRLARTKVEVSTLLESLVRSYQAIVGGRTVRIDAKEVPPVFADTNRIIQVLTNLLSNAIKFTSDDGAITFRVTPAAGQVVIAVEDTGPGIAPEEMPKLFQKFSQVGKQGAGVPRGTGLGLVVCKELVELHGGRIEVTSELDRGTTFTVRLPVYSDALALSESFRELQEAAAGEEGHGVGLIAVQTEALLRAQAAPPARQETFDRLAHDVRHHLHRGDVVLTLAPSWVVVMAAVNAEGVQAIVKRLRATVPGADRLRFGAALAPHDGSQAEALFQAATTHLEQGLASVCYNEVRP
ncbi:MAG: CHASE domain-containing protein [Candidatus Omnitrophica bacterium]|nr:CHASE domain-containing protein [Candidatus Omnitrophota bacterium]